MSKGNEFKDTAGPATALHHAGSSGFDALLASASAASLPPVEQWNPPYCGDIGFEIRRDGTWIYQTSPIGRLPLVKLFSRILRRDDDGCHYLVTPAEKVLVRVEDAPFLAVEMEVRGTGNSQELWFRTNVDDVVRCGPDNRLRFALQPENGGLKPYVRVRGRLEALVTRAVYYDLVECAVPGASDTDPPGIWSGGIWFPLASSTIPLTVS